MHFIPQVSECGYSIVSGKPYGILSLIKSSTDGFNILLIMVNKLAYVWIKVCNGMT